MLSRAFSLSWHAPAHVCAVVSSTNETSPLGWGALFTPDVTSLLSWGMVSSEMFSGTATPSNGASSLNWDVTISLVGLGLAPIGGMALSRDGAPLFGWGTEHASTAQVLVSVSWAPLSTTAAASSLSGFIDSPLTTGGELSQSASSCNLMGTTCSSWLELSPNSTPSVEAAATSLMAIDSVSTIAITNLDSLFWSVATPSFPLGTPCSIMSWFCSALLASFPLEDPSLFADSLTEFLLYSFSQSSLSL